MIAGPMKDTRKALLCGVAAVMLWSTVATAFKLSLRFVRPLELLLWSNLTAAGALGIIVAAGGRAGEVLHSRRRDLLRSGLLGLLNPFLYYLILFKAYDLLPAQTAQPLNYTWAFTLTLLSVPLLHQHIGLNDIAGLLIGYAGVITIATGGSFLHLQVDSPLGIALALGSTVIWALYWIYSAGDNRPASVCLFLNFALSLIPLSVCVLLSGNLRLPHVCGLAGAVYVGLFEMSLTYILWLTAMRQADDTAKIAGLIFLAPFFSMALIHLFVGESIRPVTLAGLALIIAGLSVQKYARFPKSGNSGGNHRAPNMP